MVVARLFNVMKNIRGLTGVVLVLWDDELVNIFEEFGELIGEFCDVNDLVVRDSLPNEVSKVVNTNYGVVNSLYPSDSAKIFGKIGITSPESILKNIVDGFLVLEIDGDVFRIPEVGIVIEWEGLPGQEIREFEEGLIIKD